MFVNFNNMHCGKKKISGRISFVVFKLFIRGGATADKKNFLYMKYVQMPTRVAPGIFMLQGASRPYYYASSFFFCLIVLKEEDARQLQKRIVLKPDDQNLSGIQEEILCMIVPYKPACVGRGWVWQNGWVFKGVESPSFTPVFILPYFQLSFPIELAPGQVTYSHFRPYMPFLLGLDTLKQTYIHAHVVSYAPKGTDVFARVPVKYEEFFYVKSGDSATFRPKKGEKNATMRGTTPLTWLRAATARAEKRMFKGVRLQPDGKEWVAQYDLDYKNRVVPLLADSNFSATPAEFNGLIPGTVLTRANYVNVLLPVFLPLDASNYLHSDFSGMWDNCSPETVRKLDEFLLTQASTFCENYVLSAKPPGFASTVECTNCFVDALQSQNFHILGIMGLLDKRKVASFIHRIAYIASPSPECVLSEKDKLFFDQVERELRLLAGALTFRVSKSLALHKNPQRRFKSVANRIVRCLLHVLNENIRAPRLVHFVGMNHFFLFFTWSSFFANP